MRYLYSFLFYLLIPFLLIRLFWRSRKNPGYRHRIGERFGFFNFPSEKTHGIWLHAVSVGETITAIPLIKALQKKYPDMPIIVTTMTPTGSARVKASLGDSVFHVYVPYDLPSAIQRFLSKVQPRIVVIMETELWPNLLFYCHKKQIPTMIANARLSECSAKGYRRFKRFVQLMLQYINIIAVQAKLDGDCYKAIGASKEQVRVVGNIKFDMTVSPSIKEAGELLRQQCGADRSVWIAASTHEGEEEIILEAFQTIKKQLPHCLLILVPRHPERFSKVAELCRNQGFKVVTRSLSEPCSIETDIFLGDTMGEMMLFYAAADIAFVGGSLMPVGGHNLLEPALYGLSIISGKHLFHFTEISQLFQQADAVKLVENARELSYAVLTLFSNPQLRQQMGENAKAVVEKNRGALNQHLIIIDKLLGSGLKN